MKRRRRIIDDDDDDDAVGTSSNLPAQPARVASVSANGQATTAGIVATCSRPPSACIRVTFTYSQHLNTLHLALGVSLISPAQSHLPFAVLRRQFPLIPGFAYSVHRLQGSTLDVLGSYFGGDAFCDELLFTALSRVRGDWTSIAVLSPDSQLRNCVNRHVLQCLEHA